MKYMLLVHSPESAWTQDEWTACTVTSAAVCHDLQAKGQFIAASPLHPVATAVSVRERQGRTLVTAGPFAETVEQLGGFFLIEVANLDEAIAVAVRLPAARKGTIEVRPLQPLDGLPADRFAAPPPHGSSTARYALLCYDDEHAWRAAGPAALRAAQEKAVELARQLQARGQYISAAPLHPVATATSVRVREGRRLVTDGPFAETHEVLGGYYIVHARDVSDAISMAAQHPGESCGTVEIRRLFELPSMPHETMR